jgi:hypothetical protein
MKLRSLWLIAIVFASHVAIASDLNRVNDVRVRMQGDETDVEIVAERMPAYQARLEAAGRILIVDLRDARVTGAPEAITGRHGVVGGVLTRTFDVDGQRMTRVTIHLVQDAFYRISVDGHSLHVLLSPSENGTRATTLRGFHAMAAKEEALATLARIQVEVPLHRVVLVLTALPSYSMEVNESGRPQLVLHRTAIQSGVAELVDLSHSVDFIRSVTVTAKLDDCVITVDRSGADRGAVSVEGTNLVWTFERQSVRSVAVESQPTTQRILRTMNEVASDGTQATNVAGATAGFAQTASSQLGGRYS